MPVFVSCENIVMWRGHFQSTGQEKSLNLSINGGEGEFQKLCFVPEIINGVIMLAFAASVWLNNVFLNTSFGK